MQSRFQRLRASLLLLVALIMVPSMAIAAANIKVEVGRESATVQFDMAFPAATFVHVGDSVTFTNASKHVPHTVTFMGGAAPGPDFQPPVPSQPSGGSYDGQGLLNSGFILPGQSYTVTFTQAGVYEYLCVLHPLMKGSIVVLPEGAPIPAVDQQAAAGNADHQHHTQVSDLVVENETDRLPVGTKKADGSVTWSVQAGAGVGSTSINLFLKPNLVVSEGDSVEFTNTGMYEPHYVSFPLSPVDAAQFFGPEGPKFDVLNVATGGSVVDGSTFVHSGLLVGNQKATFSFPKAGVYKYICYLHGESHMEGTIYVQPKGGVKVYINGEPLYYTDSLAPHLHGQHVYVPIAATIGALGGDVAWDGGSSTVTAVTKGKASATAAPGPGIKIVINGKQLSYGYDPQPHVHEGRVYVPAQEIVGALGGQLMWDAVTETIDIHIK